MKKENAPYFSLAFLTGLNLFNYLDRYVLPAVLTPLQKDLHLNASDAGWANTAFMLGYFVTSPFFGYLGDRFSRKWLIAFGIFVWSLGTTLTAFSTGFALLLAFRVLVGLGEASYATLSPAWLSDLFPPARRNNALTIFYVAIPVGSALGFIAGGQVLHHAESSLFVALKHLCTRYGGAAGVGQGDWRAAFLLAGAPGLLLALGLLFLREPARGETELDDTAPAVASHATPTLRDVAALFRLADFNLVLAGYTAYTFALAAFAFWAAKFLNEVHGVKYENADDFFGKTLVITGLVATMLGGFAATAWQRRFRAGYSTLLAVSVLLAVPAAAVAFLAHDTVLSEGCLAAAMFLLFLPTGPINTLIVESVPVMLRASAMALSIFVIHLFGDLWSPLIVGKLSDLWTVAGHSETGLQRAVLILPAVLVIAAVFWGWLAWRQAHTVKDAPAEKNASAVAVVSLANVSNVTPRADATACAVSRVCAGSQRLPRYGTGARYGQSVSTM